jgi:hypothetical protein
VELAYYLYSLGKVSKKGRECIKSTGRAGHVIVKL